MIGIILIIVGALTLSVGIFVYSTSNKNNIVTVTQSEIKTAEIKKDSPPIAVAIDNSELEMPDESVPSPIKKTKDNELEKVIQMAIADGVLTANERELIKQTAISKGVDYVAVLDDVEKRVNLLEIDSETELVDLRQKNGLDFEKFIVQKFSDKLFKVKEWAGDTFVKGVYAETTQHPDLLMEFIGYKQNIEFAVECKWRQNGVNNGIPFSTNDQLNRYRNYAEKKKVTVFIAIGLGGKGATPEKLYIVPLKDISKPFLFLSELKKYEKKVDANFYFDYKEDELK